MTELSERIEDLEQEIAKLKGKKKDFWDILSAVGALLIPLAIAFTGYIYSNAAMDAQIKSEEARAASSLELAKAGSRVSQANFIIEALEALSGEDELRKRFAIQALLLALPEKGQELLEQVAITSQNRENKDLATSALTQQLAENLFSTSPATRKAAEESLVTTWSANQQAIDAILAQTESGLSNPEAPSASDGVDSSVRVIQRLDPTLLRRNEARVNEVLNRARVPPPEIRF